KCAAGRERLDLLDRCLLPESQFDAARREKSRFALDDVERTVAAAVCDDASRNVYTEARAVCPGLDGKQRGQLADAAALGIVSLSCLPVRDHWDEPPRRDLQAVVIISAITNPRGTVLRSA